MSFTNSGGIPRFISGDRVINFYHSKDIRKNPLTFDLKTSAEYMEDEDQFKHIGELGFFGQRTTVPKSFTIDILENRQVMDTGTDGTIHYDVPMYINEQCVVTRDTSTDTESPGIDETTFKLVLSEEFKPWDLLTVDPMYGKQIIVTEDQVLQVGDSFEHVVRLSSNNKRDYYDASNLREGVRYFKLFNVLGGERDTFLSGVRVPNKPSMLTCEFRLGAGSGVELGVSAMANIGSRIGTNFRDGFIKELNMDFETFTKTWGDVAVIMDRNSMGEAIPSTARLCDVAMWLVKREHIRMIEDRAMFARAAEISVGAGYVTIAEGLWHQMRRGKIIPYSRKGGITRRHIREAVEYVYQGNEHIQPEDRYIKFKAGKYAYDNIQSIYSTEFQDQLGRLSNITNLLGTDGQIPRSPIEGQLDGLTLKTVKIKQVFLPGIGNVEVEHDMALDYLGSRADRLQAGMNPQGKSHGSFAMVIWDARNQSYSNNRFIPKGAEFVEGAPEKASVYLIKRPGDMIYSGSTNGYYDPNNSSNILSSGNKKRFVDYWSWDTGVAYWLQDPSSFVMIELQEADRRGYN